MQTDPANGQHYEAVSPRSKNKSTRCASYDDRTNAIDSRLDRSPVFANLDRSRKFEAHKSNSASVLQSTSESPAVNSDKMPCESIPANGRRSNGSIDCNVTGIRRSPGRPSKADTTCCPNCIKFSTMDLTSRIKLSDMCSCARARHASANHSGQNQSSFKLSAKRSSAIHDDEDPTCHDRRDRAPVNCFNSSKDEASSMDKSPASRRRSAQRSSNESSSSPIKSSESSSNRSLNSPIVPSHCSSSSKLSTLIRIFTSFSRSSLRFTRTHQSLLVPLLLVLCTVIRMSDACSARSTPKPRPPLPEIRPNITFQTYQCPEAYAKWYCLNGATCFFVRIGESILYNCECADGYMGQRCEFKDLEGSYLQSREKVLVETAKVAGGAFTVLVLLAFVALIFFANYKKRKSSSPISEHPPPSINLIA